MNRIEKAASLVALSLLVPSAAAIAQEAYLALDAAKLYREQAAYPPSSRALAAGEVDPIRADRAPSRISLGGPDGAAPALVVWNSAISYEAPKAVDLFASLETAGRKVGALVITGDVLDSSGQASGTVQYRDDGIAPDAAAGDGIWSARWQGGKLAPGTGDTYLVKVLATTEKGEPRQAAGGFLYGKPGARATGRYRDEVRDGSLILSAEVEVLAAGRFHAEGTLYGANGEPLGVAQASADLPKGMAWIELPFYGKMLADRKAEGPFRLGSLALSTVGRMPNVLNDLALDVYVTRAYSATAFTNAPYGDAKLLDTAVRLERSVAEKQ
ncbi:MAG TPA: choice-of-anchor X domain-containing protein [Thermoanaerobaculia bacterium]|nr:choice-of-anchor X domain-containing protein [Thermoanaerobaculia bacterium]